MQKPIKIIDLFAGPGGLGEGFSSLRNDAGESIFKIAISIEKEVSAHATLTLRAFFRQFPNGAPDEYYEFLKGNLGKTPEDQLYKCEKFKEQYASAKNEALHLTLGKDNRKIYAAIRSAISPDEDSILIGGPPCQAYSLAGPARNINNDDYVAENDHRNFLYKEYLKVIARFQPKIFVMENVKGMLSAKVEGKPIFDSIRKDLKNPCSAVNTQPESGRSRHKYQMLSLTVKNSNMSEELAPRDYIIRSECYGIPQRRHRVIIVGIRDDLAHLSDSLPLLSKEDNRINTKDVLDDLPPLRSGLSKTENTLSNWIATIQNIPAEVSGELETRGLRPLAEKMNALKEDVGPFTSNQGKVMGLKKTKKLTIDKSKSLQHWYNDKRLAGFVVNHETRGHLGSDLHRYFFSSTWAQVAKKLKWDKTFPKAIDYPEALIPNHKNFKSGKFTDRFRVQLDNTPSTTIICHLSKDGHSFIHYDPLQCRSLTVREAARLQTFPDNYFFVGNRTQQYVQVGNAVPPFLAHQISKTIFRMLS